MRDGEELKSKGFNFVQERLQKFGRSLDFERCLAFEVFCIPGDEGVNFLVRLKAPEDCGVAEKSLAVSYLGSL